MSNATLPDITSDVFTNIIVPQLSALDLNALRQVSKTFASHSKPMRAAFLKALKTLSIEDFNTLNLPDNIRTWYLITQLKRREFTPGSYIWFIKEAISTYDQWLLAPYFVLRGANYFPMTYIHECNNNRCIMEIIIWPPATFYVASSSDADFTRYKKYKYDKATDDYYSRGWCRSSFFKSPKNYVSFPCKLGTLFLPEDTQFYLLENRTKIYSMLRITHFPLTDNTIDPEAPSPEEIDNLDSIAFQTYIYYMNFRDLVLGSFDTFLPEDRARAEKYLKISTRGRSENELIESEVSSSLWQFSDWQTKADLRDAILLVSVFNLIMYMKPNAIDTLLRICEKQNWRLPLSADPEKNNKLLLELIQKQNTEF